MGEDAFNEQLRKAFQDLQAQIIDSRERQKNADHSKNAMKNNIRIANMVKTQLELVLADRAVYRSVGRIFVRGTVASEIHRQEEDVRVSNERIAALDKQKEYLEKSVAETEKNLRELVQSRRS